MHLDRTPFEQAAESWNAEVNAEAARLLNDGKASGPLDAQRQAHINVRARRATAAQSGGVLLTKVLHDQGGPL